MIVDLIEQRRLVRLLQYRNRIVRENEIYHITQRAPGKEKLFLEESDYLYFLYILKDTSISYKLQVFSFVLMPNHVHLLLRIEKRNLSEAMKHLFQRYAIYFNKKYQRKGHVFSGRFRSALCRGDVYFLAISLYIHLNPFKSNLCKKPEDYRFSSVLTYVKSVKKQVFIRPELILRLLHEDINKAREIYKRMLTESESAPYKTPFEDTLWLNRFVSGVINILKKRLTRSSEIAKLEENIERLKKGAGKPIDKKAKKYLIQQLIANGYKISKIAEELSISRQAIYKILK